MMAKTSYIHEYSQENKDHAYASIETYLAYMANNPDHSLAKYKGTNFPPTQGTTGDSESTGSENSSSANDSNSNGTNAKEGDGKKSEEEEKYEGEDDCQEEITQWLEQAKKWGDKNGFPGFSKEKDETKSN